MAGGAWKETPWGREGGKEKRGGEGEVRVGGGGVRSAKADDPGGEQVGERREAAR